MATKRLAILATHPIQYQATWFRKLSERPDLDLEVLYCHIPTPQEQADAGFGVAFEWDIPLLDGYNYRILKNVAKQPSLHRFMGMNTPEVYEIIRQEKYDAVLLSGWYFLAAWQAFWACKRTGTPVMVRGDSNLRYYQNYRQHPVVIRMLKYILYRQFIPRFDVCLAAGTQSKDYYLYYGAKPETIFTVPHIIDESIFDIAYKISDKQRQSIRSRWGLSENTIVFIFSGKLIARKRPFDFIRAIQIAARQNSSICGLIIGDGPLMSEVEVLVENEKLPIKFAGFINQSEIASMYFSGDVLALPSYDTWGLVVNEAMMTKRPCILSDEVGCATDLIIPEHTGYTFSIGDVDGLAKQMISIASNPKKLQKMGEQAYGRVKEEQTQAIDGIIEAMQYLFRENHS